MVKQTEFPDVMKEFFCHLVELGFRNKENRKWEMNWPILTRNEHIETFDLFLQFVDNYQ